MHSRVLPLWRREWEGQREERGRLLAKAEIKRRVGTVERWHLCLGVWDCAVRRIDGASIRGNGILRAQSIGKRLRSVTSTSRVESRIEVIF